MVVFKILFLLAAVNVVHPKPFLLKEMKVKKHFEFSLKPLGLIKKWIPIAPMKVEHKIAKRSPFPDAGEAPLNVEPPPASLLKVDLDKSLELHSGFSTIPPHLHDEGKLNKHPPPPVGLLPGHEKIHEEPLDHTPKPPGGQLLTRIDLGPASVLPPEIHRRNLLLHVGLPPVSPIPPPHVDHEEHPPLGPDVSQICDEYERHLLVEPKPKVTLPSVIADEGPIFGFPESPLVTGKIHGHPPPPPPPHLPKSKPLPPGNENEGTLDSFFGSHTAESLEKSVHFPSGHPNHMSDFLNGATGQGSDSTFAGPQFGIQEKQEPPHHMPVPPHQFTGQGTFLEPEFAPPPPAGIQEKPVPRRYTSVLNPTPPAQENNRGSLFTDISRADDINAYMKAVDALPLVKPPLEEIVRGNSLDTIGSKLTVDAKAEPSNFARGSRLALYFGNILLQMMSEAIGSARTAIGQYSMPSKI